MIQEKLQAALNNKELNNYIWKYAKQTINNEVMQPIKKLIDMTEPELKNCYDYCNAMLYNENSTTPGRFQLLNIVQEQRLKCNTVLFLRWLETEHNIPTYSFLESLHNFVNLNREAYSDIKSQPIKIVFNDELPAEYDKIPISTVIDGCLDRLGKYSKQGITLPFIAKLGIWFTSEESQDLTELDSHGKIKDKLELIKERHFLKATTKLHFSPKGLSYKQFRAMINLRSKKYSELTTEQLETLRNVILFSLEDEIHKHIDFWNSKKNEINKVAISKNYKLS
jgi:hypothetical protein